MNENQACSHTNHNVGCVSLVPIFNHLEEEQMNEIMRVVHSGFYKKGEIIYHAGDESNSLYIVNHGQVKIYRLSESGKEQLVRILDHGDFTGELALFQESVHTSYAEAMVDTQVCMIKRDELQEILTRYPSISLKFLTEFAHRLDRSEEQTTRFATEKVDTRLALYLAESVEAENKSTIELAMSKKELASYLGTTPETISRRLNEFEADKLIKMKGQREIEVLDLDGLLSI